MDTDRAPAFDQERNLNRISEHLEAVLALLPPDQAGLCLAAAALDVLPAGRCPAHYLEALHLIRNEVDALIAEAGPPH